MANHLSSAPHVDKNNPESTYVYVHIDINSTPFFVDVGRGRDAWEAERPYLWTRYVAKHLKGVYTVKIIAQGLPDSAARRLRNEIIAQESNTLVNLANLSRPVDIAASDLYWKIKRQIWPLIDEGKALETSDPEAAIRNYMKAIHFAEQVARIQPEGGFVGRLLDEERDEFGLTGVVQAIDRLTLCLRKLGHERVAREIAIQYFRTFRRDRQTPAAARVLKRIGLNSFEDT